MKNIRRLFVGYDITLDLCLSAILLETDMTVPDMDIKGL